jgi:hypothetical protein
MSFDAIVNDLAERLGVELVTVERTRKEVVRHAAPPRIVVVPTTETIEPAQEIGRQDIPGGSATRQLYHRELRCEIYCWGRDRTEAQDLLHNTIVALHHGVQGSYRLGQGEWRNEREDTFSDLLLGDMLMLEAFVHIPVVDQLKTLKPISVFEHAAKWIPASHPAYGFAQLNYGGPAVTYGPTEGDIC